MNSKSGISENNKVKLNSQIKIEAPFYQTGIDIVSISEISNLDNPLDVILTKTEWNSIFDTNNRVEKTAGKFAAKEAIMKVLGSGIDTINFTDIEIINDINGKPEVFLSNTALKIWQIKGFKYLDISISHHDNYAIAMAVATKRD